MEERAVPIVVKDGSKYKFEKEEILRIVDENNVGDLPVAVISVAGAFRKGKSFLLNFFLHYLSAENKDNWLDDHAEKLKGFAGDRGFEWKGGSQRHTDGILMWSKIFKLSTENGGEVAVILMDTQGTFDGKSSMKDNNMIFILSVLLSSVQIYNVSRHINEGDLQNLEYFVDFAKVLQTHSEYKAFQSLKFLVRDWQFPYDYEYGEDGGKRLLKKILNISDDRASSLQNVRGNLQSAFAKLSCFLLPHPGKSVARDPKFKGSLSEIDEEFLKHMKDLIPLIFHPRNLSVKSINGKRITCNIFVTLFDKYMTDCRNNRLPEPQSLVQDTAEASLSRLIDSCLQKYRSKIDKFGKENDMFILPNELEEKHKMHTKDALDDYKNENKLGYEEVVAHFQHKLHENIIGYFERCVMLNGAKMSGNTYKLNFANGHSAYAASGTIIPKGKDLFKVYNVRIESEDGEKVTAVSLVPGRTPIHIPIIGITFKEWINKSKEMNLYIKEPSLQRRSSRASHSGSNFDKLKKSCSSFKESLMNQIQHPTSSPVKAPCYDIFYTAMTCGKRYRLNFFDTKTGIREYVCVFGSTVVYSYNNPIQENIFGGTLASIDGGVEEVFAVNLEMDVPTIDQPYGKSFNEWLQNHHVIQKGLKH